jgi:uncharacterized protein (TIGR00255 family)
MTGYGNFEYRNQDTIVSVEIKTVNHRYRDFFLKTPRQLNPVEDRIRKLIGEYVKRGRIECLIKYKTLNNKNKSVEFDKGLAENYIKVVKELAKLDDSISDNISLDLIAKYPDVVVANEEKADEEEVWEAIETPLINALKQVVESRQIEGNALKKDMISKCVEVNRLVDSICDIVEKGSGIYQEKLVDKVSGLLEGVAIDEQRILTEVVIYTDKTCVDEETTRLKSHTHRLMNMLEKNGNESTGRKMDFLLQEMNREINTIGSKANDLEVANKVVDAKNEIEKLREQVQNIE